MEIVETWYFQIWVNFGGMADLIMLLPILLINLHIYVYTRVRPFLPQGHNLNKFGRGQRGDGKY